MDAGNVGQIQLSDFAAARQRHCHTLPIASDSLRCLVDEDQLLFPATGHPLIGQYRKTGRLQRRQRTMNRFPTQISMAQDIRLLAAMDERHETPCGQPSRNCVSAPAKRQIPSLISSFFSLNFRSFFASFSFGGSTPKPPRYLCKGDVT